MTIDRNDPKLQEIHESGPLKGQQKDYLVLSDEERAKGYVRPVRRSYVHVACGAQTTMGINIAETYARDPKFYSGTFCVHCQQHFRLLVAGVPQFLWRDGEPVGSTAEEAAEWNVTKVSKEAEKDKGSGI